MNFLSLLKRKIIYKCKKKINIDIDGFRSNDLDKLFFFYGSDKSNIFKISNQQGHGYSKYYTKYLKKYKKKKIKILEIGSYAGGSAAAFKKYFSYSKIFCLDINISKFKFKSKDIYVYGLDVSNIKKLKKVINKIVPKNKKKFFDLIIDDGSHNLKDILISINSLFEYLKKDGFYIIEDYMLPTNYKYNRNTNDILIDKMINSLNKKKLFKSRILDKDTQLILHKNIKKIYTHKGNLKDSHICFIKKR